jgi:hypothetical protein
MKLKGLLALLSVVITTLTTPALAKATYPAFWVKQSKCIRHYESRNRWHIHDGAFQIIQDTWQRMKPRGFHVYAAEDATPKQQTFVAWRIWVHNGRSWGNNNQWPNTARVCGVY